MSKMEAEKCVICGFILDTNTVLVKKRGLLKFIESSIAREDGKADYFNDRAEIKLHKTCRNCYNNPKCIEAVLKRKKRESEKVLELSSDFDYQNKCLFCEKDASFRFEQEQNKNPSSSRISVGHVMRLDTQNSIMKACTTHDDDWSKQVLLRIDKVNILEKNARYHYSCYSKFCHSYRAAGIKRGRPQSQDNENAMNQVFGFIEETEDTEQVLISLVGQHKCLWHPGDPDYCNKPLTDALWADIARQLPHSGSPLTPDLTRSKWQALRDARAGRGSIDTLNKKEDLMSFLDDVDEVNEFNEQYIDALDEKPDQSDQEDPLDTISPEPEAITPKEKPKKHINRERIHKRTIKRCQPQRYGLDPPNPQLERDESDSEGIPLHNDGHAHFCLSLVPLMRALPLQKAVGVRIKILQLLHSAMADESV